MRHTLLGKAVGTLRREGAGTAARKVARRLRYRWMRTRYPKVPDQHRWAELKGKFSGERAFLIGNGPSLNKLPLHLLRNEFTLCFNRFYIMMERLAWRPDFYMTVDDLVLSDLVDEIPAMMGVSDHFFFPDIHFRGHRYFDDIGRHQKIWWMRPKMGRGFSTEMPYVYPGGSVIYEGMQVLGWLGFSEIYFVGVDMNFQIHKTVDLLGGDATSIQSKADDDPNHFDPRYFGQNRKYHQPEDHVVRYIMSSLEYAADATPALGLRIVNAGVDSRVDYFPRADFRGLFDLNEQGEREIIDEVVRTKTSFESLADLEAAATLLDDAAALTEAVDVAAADLEAGLPLVKSSVFTHLPLGPFFGRYYFVRRAEA